MLHPIRPLHHSAVIVLLAALSACDRGDDSNASSVVAGGSAGDPSQPSAGVAGSLEGVSGTAGDGAAGSGIGTTGGSDAGASGASGSPGSGQAGSETTTNGGQAGSHETLAGGSAGQGTAGASGASGAGGAVGSAGTPGAAGHGHTGGASGASGGGALGGSSDAGEAGGGGDSGGSAGDAGAAHQGDAGGSAGSASWAGFGGTVGSAGAAGSIDVPPEPSLVINEFLASNQDGITDPNGGAPDWIELHNPGSANVDLGGYFLSDDPVDLQKAELASGLVIEAGGMFLLWADSDVDEGDDHLPFNLAKSGETIMLTSPDGQLLDMVIYGVTTTDVSVARVPDGTGDFVDCANPTPREPNDLSCAE